MVAAVSKIRSAISRYPCSPRLSIAAQAAATTPPERLPESPGRHVDAARPVGVAEVLVATQRAVPVQQHRRALERVPELVRVRRDRRDPGEPEVEGRDRVSEPLRPRKDEAAHAAVDVEAEVVLERQLRHLLDRIDETVRIVAGGARRSPRCSASRDRASSRRRRASRRRTGAWMSLIPSMCAAFCRATCAVTGMMTSGAVIPFSILPRSR